VDEAGDEGDRGGGPGGRAASGRRRWPWAVAAVLALAAGAGAWGWYGWLPDHRPGLRDGERYGVDVSGHQGDVDWERVAGDGIAFAYVKATEGGDFVDARFRENWDGAGAAGLDRGAYHFFTLCRPGAEQAEHFLATVPVGDGTLPPALDLELAGNCSQRPDRARVAREVTAFLGRVEAATGEPVVLYVGDDFEDRYRLRDDLRADGPRPIWHRRLHLRPDVEGWWLWQASDRAAVAGIDGGVDLDVMRPG
jgi:lysozyme